MPRGREVRADRGGAAPGRRHPPQRQLGIRANRARPEGLVRGREQGWIHAGEISDLAPVGRRHILVFAEEPFARREAIAALYECVDPDDVIMETALVYVRAFETITGQTFEPPTEPVLPRIRRNLARYMK